MKKVVIIGVGSTMFTRQILSSFYCHPEQAKFQVTLENLDGDSLKQPLTHKLSAQEILVAAWSQ